MLQRTKFKIVTYSLISLILLAMLAFWIYFSTAQARDYRRLADLKVWQGVLSDYYADFGTYAISNCRVGETLSRCLGKSGWDRAAFNLDDPLGSGTHNYVVAGMSEADYEISFTLESGIGGLRPGQYIWTKNGVKK